MVSIERGIRGPAFVVGLDVKYGLAAMLEMHYFEETLVRAVFGPKFEEIRKMGVIDRWLDEKYQEGLDQGISQGMDQGISQGMDQGMDQGISQGMDQGARQVVLRLLSDKFGQAPAQMAERVQRADAAWRQDLSLLIAKARTLEDLDLS